MGLKEYRKKRNFKKTTEPQAGAPSKSAPIFVVQEHLASHLHYDFRIEAFGTLKSWAVPKGPSLTPGEKRLAVEVEDHPIAYAKFKGRIPQGEYGAGTVKIWDHGVWVPPERLKDALHKGRLEFELKGKKLKGQWLLVRTGRPTEKKHQWLLIKRNETKEKSLLPVKIKTRADPFPSEIKPQLATLAQLVPKGSQWIHEIKLDGYRTLAFIKKNRCQLRTRSGLDWTDHYPSIAKQLAKLKVTNAILDGEIVVLDEKGHSNFAHLQSALKKGDDHLLVYYVFDLLYLDKTDLRGEALEKRKQGLKELLKKSKPKQIVFSDHLRAQGEDLFKQACQLGLEGIVSKERNRAYNQGRNTDWQKIKCSSRQELVIGGFTDPQGSREGFGALLMGVYENQKMRHDKKLRYVGRVGTGFDSQVVKELLQKFKKLKAKVSPFVNTDPSERGVHWLEPKLVAEIEFKTWTQDHILRHASFKGLREDKKAQHIILEIPKVAAAKTKVVGQQKSAFHITHPERMIYAKDKITKLDVANYYRSVAPWLLKYIVDRPLSFMRCPEGAGIGCFYQKHVSSSILSETQENDMHEQKVTSIKSEAGLLQLIQWGVLELHAWQGRVSAPEHPDQIIFDLDPDEKVPWKKVIETAFRLKELLERLDLKSFVKTTGGKGLHVQVPIAPRYGWDEVKSFSKSVCRQLEIDFPDEYVINMSKKKRKNKIFLDYLRNGAGSTAVAPFSLRSKDYASVAVPLEWSELKTIKSAAEFDLQKTLNRLAKQTSDPWNGYFKLKQKIKILDQANKKK